MDRGRNAGRASRPVESVRTVSRDRRAAVRFEVRTLNDAGVVAEQIARRCPRPEQVRLGLTELLGNAIEHDDLAVTGAEKAALLASGQWESTVERLRALPEHAAKTVEVRFERHSGECHVWIRDQGLGFDFRPYTAASDYVGEAHPGNRAARGIALARMVSFDWLEYLGPGNEVHAVIADDGSPAHSPHPRSGSKLPK